VIHFLDKKSSHRAESSPQKIPIANSKRCDGESGKMKPMIEHVTKRQETVWEGMRLVVEPRSKHWQVFVYDPAKCEILYVAERVHVDAAKLAAVDFVAMTRFGPEHDLKPEIILRMLVWVTA
jgi:hypothetical protein